MKKESLDNELKGLSPLLRDPGQRDPGFRVPEGYFEALEDSVFSRVGATGNRRKPMMKALRGGFFTRFSRTQVMWAAAAIFALVLAAIWFISPKPAQQPALATQELTEAEIEAYVLENIRDFDAELIADVPVNTHIVPETRHTSPATTKPGVTDPIDDLSDEELELLLKEMSDEELENLIKT